MIQSSLTVFRDRDYNRHEFVRQESPVKANFKSLFYQKRRSERVHKKSRPKMSDEKWLKNPRISTQSNITCDAQEQYSSFVKNKRKPDVVIKLFHWASQNITWFTSSFYHYAIIIPETGAKSKKNHPAININHLILLAYNFTKGIFFAQRKNQISSANVQLPFLNSERKR